MTLFYPDRKVYTLLVSVFLAAFMGCELQETDFIQPTPIALDATNVTSASFTASWEPVLGSNIYFIDVSPDPDFASFVSGFQSLEVDDSTSVVVSGLSVEETYYYRVRAKKGNTISGNSNVISVETGLLPAPVALEPSELMVFEFVANWSTVDEAASYLIEVASDSSFNHILSTYNRKEVVANSLVIEDLDFRKTYYYRVLTKRLNKTSSYSNVMKVEPCISKDCKLSRIVFPSFDPQEMTFSYDSEGKIIELNSFYTDFPDSFNEKWTVRYDAGDNIDSVAYYMEGDLYTKYKFIYSDSSLTSITVFDSFNELTAVWDFIYNNNKQLIGYRRYDDITRVNTTYYEDYELDENGNISKILNMDGELVGEFKYDDAFNPKMLIPFEVRLFIYDSFSGYNSKPYHSINNPIYARGTFFPDDPNFIEEEVFIYNLNEKGIAIQRKGFFSLQYEFTGCNF